MARLIIKVDGSFNGPQIAADPRLNAGSLILAEPGHPTTPWNPATSPSSIPNIAADELAAVLGGAAASLSVTNTMSAATGSIETTAKGGLHFLIANTGSAGNEALHIDLPTPLKTYIETNPTHSYFLSLWARITRRTGVEYTIYALNGLMSTTAGTNRLGFQQSGTTGNTSTTPSGGILGRTIPALTNGVGDFRADLADDAVTLPISERFAAAGNINSTVDNAPSWILYAAYLEDLTVSGRTYADASAADADAYSGAFGVGGRYYGDTFTDPATIP